jgi:hypothetical protein
LDHFSVFYDFSKLHISTDFFPPNQIQKNGSEMFKYLTAGPTLQFLFLKQPKKFMRGGRRWPAAELRRGLRPSLTVDPCRSKMRIKSKKNPGAEEHLVQ